MLIMSHREINEHVDSGQMYWAKQTRFPSGAVEMSVTKIPEARLRWLNNELPRKKWKVELTVEEKRERSLRAAVARARQKIRYTIKTLGADHMVTLTFRENLEDIELVKKYWQEFVRLVRVKYPEWQFVAVPEKQDRGAWHLHVAVKGFQDVKYLRKRWYKALGGTGNEVGEDTPGQIDLSGPKNRWRQQGTHGLTWNANKLGAYMTKYIHKTFDESVKHAKRYWASRGIKIEQYRYWLAAGSFTEAVIETYERIEFMGNYGLDVRIRPDDGIIWLSAAYREIEDCPF